MIRKYKIHNEKDEYGYYIIPDRIINKEGFLENIHRHIVDRYKLNLVFAIICVVDSARENPTIIDLWGYNRVTLNNVSLYYNTHYLDEENDTIYEVDDEEEIEILIRKLKLNKIYHENKD